MQTYEGSGVIPPEILDLGNRWREELLYSLYRCDPRIAGNTFQDLLRLRETADNTERYIERDIRVTNINTVKFIDKFLNTNTSITRQPVRIARTLEAEWKQVMRGSVRTGAKEDESSTGRVWTAGFNHFTARSRLAGVL
jgi:hypothetical protein